MSGSDPLRFVGTTIAEKYRVDRVLGEGGFGVVYAGEHLALGEPIALKCIKLGPFVGQDRATEVFLREARVLFSLAHPSIVRMYDVGTVQTPAGNVPYVVLELVHGVSLEEEIARRRAANSPFPAQDILAIFESVLDGLSFAHQRGIAHRDLKPSNVMLVRNANGALGAKLLDFGTARVASKLTSIGATSAAGFTPRYAAPEQWDPALGTTGPASDVFSLGLLLAECCTLSPALAGETPSEILEEVMAPERRPLVASRRADLSPAVDHVIARATRVAPPERFASIREMLDALRDALSRPPPAYGYTAPQPPPFVPPSPPVVAIATSPPMLAPYHPPPAFPMLPGAPHPEKRGGASGFVIAFGIVLALVFVLGVGSAVASIFFARRAASSSSSSDPTATPVVAAGDTPPLIRGGHRIKSGTITPGPDIDRRAIKTEVESHFTDIDACYGAALDGDPKLRGNTLLSIRVDPAGQPTETFCDQQSTLKEQDFCDCLATSASAWHFPATSAGTRFTYGLDLAP